MVICYWLQLILLPEEHMTKSRRRCLQESMLDLTDLRAHAIEEGSGCEVRDVMCDLESAKGGHSSRVHNPLGRLLPVKLQHSASRSMSAH